MKRSLKIDQALADAFSNFRAEHIGSGLLQQFTQPQYFPELATHQPCFLIGGRGTGKTTTLRSLSYKFQFELRNKEKLPLSEWKYIGLYLKVSTGRVASFRGPEKTEREWERIFGHYLNLLFCIATLEFFEWHERTHPSQAKLPPQVLWEIARQFGVQKTESVSSTLHSVNSCLIDFEILVNSIGNSSAFKLTPLGAPFDALMDSISHHTDLDGSYFYVLIDEFENLSNYQQRVLNTLIKHARPPYTFKIGVRELGIRERCTLNEAEQLVDPADYRRIDITETLSKPNVFENFAAEVCAKRLNLATGSSDIGSDYVPGMFEQLTAEDEAELLGVSAQIRPANAIATSKLRGKALERFSSMSNLERYTMWKLEEEDDKKFIRYLRSPEIDLWNDRYNNYKVLALFNIKAGKSGIRKYYCGWKTLCKLASGNIRYVLELVHRSIQIQAQSAHSGKSIVTAEIQTIAAQNIGQKNIRELEGFSVYGARMAKLVLSLGRIFQVMAESPIGHTPEVTQFTIPQDNRSLDDSSNKGRDLMDEAIMHLALVRFSGTKPQEHRDTKDYDYALHPIFSAFFGYSHRRKRKMELSYAELLGLSESPKIYIDNVLKKQNRIVSDALPEQMTLFQDFYEAPDR